MGTLNIIELCKKNGNPKPLWNIRAESVVTTFFPSVFIMGTEHSRPESLEAAVLTLLKKTPLSKAEIAKSLGHKHISGGLKKTLHNLFAQQKITYTIPEKPNSRLQKYKLKNI